MLEQRASRGVPGTGFPVHTTVRDALYDRIPLAKPELALISTPIFLRLERIQQLGFVSRIWPGARHTRYEHSLGVLHLARLAVDHLRAIPAGAWITDDDARVITAAALLHDIGHYPFSHAIEELGPPVLSHEIVGRNLIEAPEIASILQDQWHIDPARVAAIIAPQNRTLPASDLVLRAILSGPLDIDKLDYLPRDARGCNVPYGGVDYGRLIDALDLANIPIDEQTSSSGSALHIVVGPKGISPLHSLINARQEMFDNIYWHHTNRACMVMLLRAVQEALLTHAITPHLLTTLDDAALLALFHRTDMPESTRRLTEALERRQFHKRAVEISARAFELYARLGNLFFDPLARRDVEIQLAATLSTMIQQPVPSDAILIDIPKPEKWRTDVWVAFDRPPIGFRPIMPWKEVVGLEPSDFKRYEEHRRLIRIVTAEPYRDIVATHWESMLLPLLGGVL